MENAVYASRSYFEPKLTLEAFAKLEDYIHSITSESYIRSPTKSRLDSIEKINTDDLLQKLIAYNQYLREKLMHFLQEHTTKTLHEGEVMTLEEVVEMLDDIPEWGDYIAKIIRELQAHIDSFSVESGSSVTVKGVRIETLASLLLEINLYKEIHYNTPK